MRKCEVELLNGSVEVPGPAGGSGQAERLLLRLAALASADFEAYFFLLLRALLALHFPVIACDAREPCPPRCSCHRAARTLTLHYQRISAHLLHRKLSLKHSQLGSQPSLSPPAPVDVCSPAKTHCQRKVNAPGGIYLETFTHGWLPATENILFYLNMISGPLH